jgi:hypothetical protein
MTNDSQAVEEKIERMVVLFFTERKQQAFWFWGVGFGIVIPVLTYVSSSLIGLLISVSLTFFRRFTIWVPPVIAV